jgi:hypothetical protein
MPKTFTLLDTFSLDGFYCTQGYGLRPTYYKQFGILYHEGVDFGHKNKKIIVRSPISGKVIHDEDKGTKPYGDNVKIWDDKQLCMVQVCHLEHNLVKLGQRIKAGDPIGEMGSTGNSTADHVHFNFVQTDEKGNRLYGLRSQNLGYLDPQHPLDPNPPKYPPKVEPYEVKWVKEIENNSSEIPNSSEKTYTQQEWEGLRHENQDNWDKWQEAKADYEEQKTITEEKTKELTGFLETLAGKLSVVVDKAQIIGAVDRLLEVENQLKDANKRLEQQEKKNTLEKDELKIEIDKLRKEIEQQQVELDREKKQNETLLARVSAMETKMETYKKEMSPIVVNRVTQLINSVLERLKQ